MKRLVLLLGVAMMASLVASGFACSPAREEPDGKEDAAGHTEQTEKGTTEPAGISAAPREQADKTKVTAEQDTPEKETGAELAKVPAPENPVHKTIADDPGALRVEVPRGWEHVAGAASEVGSNWSEFGSIGITSSITTSADLDAWHTSGGVPGAYLVASRTLARYYAEDDLVASGPNDFSAACEGGARRDFERGTYLGRVQEWEGCGDDRRGRVFTLAAAPEGRECIVLLQVAGMRSAADVEAGRHLVDTFEVDCKRMKSEDPLPARASASPTATTSATATATATATASAAAQGELICDEYGCMTPEEVAQQKQIGEGWWPGSGRERPQPDNCAATKMRSDGC